MQPPSIAIVIPCFCEERHLARVVQAVPTQVRWIVIVDDASTDATPAVIDQLADRDPRIVALRLLRNGGVGAATRAGFEIALDLRADFVIKLDGDGQMDPAWLSALLEPALEGRADCCKGNRFLESGSLRAMPVHRLFGNIALTLMTKFASGYWHIFDVQNGFLCLSREVLERIDLDQLATDYFFENSLLCELAGARARIVDVPIQSIYEDESSHISLPRVLGTFPPRLAVRFLRRIFRLHLSLNVTTVGIYYFASAVLLLSASTFGAWVWQRSMATGQLTSSGTVGLVLLPLLVGFQLLVQAIGADVEHCRSLHQEPSATARRTADPT